MKVKTTLLTLGVAFLFTPSVFAENSAETLFEVKCASCHVKTRPSDISTLVAPPMMGVMKHVKMKYDKKEEAVKFITDYALNPHESKAVCIPRRIKAFGLMPSQKGLVSEKELNIIAAWAYDNFGSQNCTGKRGQSNCQGKACKGK